MKKLAPVAALVALVSGAPEARAARWIVVDDIAPSTDEPLEVATRFVEARRPALSLEGVTLVPRTTLALRTDGTGGFASTVRFAQERDGLRVYGGEVIVRVDANGGVTAAVSQAYDGLTVSTEPTLDVGQATELALAHAPLATSLVRSELAVLPVPETGRLVWILDLADRRGGTRVFVDAHDGTVVRVQTMALDVNGRVYSMNSVETPVPVDVELLDIDLADPQRLTGWDGLLQVTNYVSGSSMSGNYVVAQTLGPNVGADFLYDPPALATDPTDAFAQVNLYHHLTDIRRFFAALGVEMTTPAWKLTAIANVTEDGAPLDNAFYSEMGIDGAFAAPNLIAIGQGSMNDFAYDSDVFKHEFGHYVTGVAIGYNLGLTHSTSYGFSPFSGAIDEGIADYFACSDNGNPILGEASLGLLGATRDLTVTNKRCPDDMVGEPHADGEIIGSASWSLRTLLGADKADKLVWGALSMLPPGATYGDFGRAVIQTANDMVASGDLQPADVTATTTVLADRGIEGCDAEMPLEGTEARKLNLVGLDLLGQLFGAGCSALQGLGVEMPGLFHFYRDTLPTDAGVRFRFDVSAQGPGTPSLRVVLRKGEHATFQASGQVPLPKPQTFDREITFDGSGVGELVVDATTTPAFEPGARYYVAVTNPGCPVVSASVTAENIPGDAPTTSSSSSTSASSAQSGGTGTGGATNGTEDPGDIDVRGDACNCRVDSRPIETRAGVVALAVALAAAARRRKRRS